MKAAYRIPQSWITSSLGDAAFRTLALLISHKCGKTNEIRVTNDQLAAERGIKPRNVQMHLNEAEKLGFISKKFDDKNRRFFVMNVNTKSDDDQHHGVTTGIMTTSITPCRPASSQGDDQHHGGMMTSITSPTPPIYEQPSFQQSLQPPAHTHAREARTYLVDGGGGGSAVKCSPEVKAIEIIGKAELQIENRRLIQSVVSLLEAGWTEEKIGEALGNVKEYEKGGMIGNYYAFITKGRPQKKQPAEASDKPKRITTKDGKKVLIDGEWLLAKTPYENMPAEPRVESKLGDEFNRFVHEIHGLKLDMDCRIQAEMDLLGIFDQASAGTIDAGQFKQQAASLIQKLKGAVA